MALVVFRLTSAPGAYAVVGSTDPQTLPKERNTFSTDIKVRSGDLLGFWAQSDTACALLTFDSGDTVVANLPSGIPSAGATTTMFDAGDGVRLNMQVRLERRGSR
jgi:hypothetical protein